MSEKAFKSVQAALQECNMLPEKAKEILKIVKNAVNEVDENDLKRLWILFHDFMKESIEDLSENKELILCYQCILNLAIHVIDVTENILSVYNNEFLLKTIMLFQRIYSTNLTYKLKLEIVKMCFNFCQKVYTFQNEFENSLDFDSIMAQNFHLTLNYVFDTIKKTTKKFDMKTLSSLLREFCKVVSSLSNNKNGLNLIILNLDKVLQHTMFLETEAGKLAIADVYTSNQQLFLRFHQIVIQNLPKANKLEATAYGEIYFISWINSNSSMREVIEQQGIFDIICKTLELYRKGSSFRTYHCALIFLQSIQNHRKHLLFSKVITQLYAPVLWRHLESESGMIRCNATEILARAYPLEKRGEGREVSSRFLIKQQNTLLDLLIDPCPPVRIAAVKGICSCMRYCWDSFEEYQINKCFNLFTRLIDESVVEVRRVVFYGLCQILDENKSYTYLKVPFFMSKLKHVLNDENEKVRRAFIHLLLKIKKVDSQLDNSEKICYAKIVDLRETASALAREEKQNGLLLVDLIFDNFIGDKVPDRHATLKRFYMFYKINPIAFRKLMFFSEKHLDFNSACQLILSLLKTIHIGLKIKEERLKSTDKENSIPEKKRKITNDDLDNTSDANYSSNSDIDVDDNEQNDHTNVCCILDCVNCLMILHCKTFREESNHKKMKEIQDSCTSCLIKLLKFYKEGDAYFSAMSLGSLIPVSKLTPHVSAPSTALSILQQLPYDMNNAEEEIDTRKVDCLVYTLCMWNRGYEILQFVNIWIDEAFKTLNLNETQYPESTIKEGKRVRFKTNIEECKPLTGILLINSMLSNPYTQKTLMDSDVNKKNIYDLITYLQRVKPAIENRISLDNVLNDLLSDEVLTELFALLNRLHIIYHCHEESLCIDEIIKYQISILDWIINNLMIHDLRHKNETTITFVVQFIRVVNRIVINMCIMAYVDQLYLDHFFNYCAAVHNNLGSRILISLAASLVQITKHYYFLKQIDTPISNTSTLINCVCSVISVLSESKYNEKRFTNVIGEPPKFRRELTMLVLETYKIGTIEFKLVFTTFIENIINIMANQIREIVEVDFNEELTDMPFTAYQLTMVILNNAQLRKEFSSNAILIFSTDIYKNDCTLLLSAISFIYTLSFQLNQTKRIDLEQVVKLLYNILMDYDITTTPLGNNCTLNNTRADTEKSILETSDFSNDCRIMDLKKKGRSILIATAKQLHIALSE